VLKNYFFAGIWKVNDENSRIRDPNPDPDPLVRGMDPRIRIHTKMSWIRNTSLMLFIWFIVIVQAKYRMYHTGNCYRISTLNRYRTLPAIYSTALLKHLVNISFLCFYIVNSFFSPSVDTGIEKIFVGLQVIRPRLQGSMMLRVTTMEILKLTYWDPARDMLSVLKVIFGYSIAKFSFMFDNNME
jgi:hypothetical protein